MVPGPGALAGATARPYPDGNHTMRECLGVCVNSTSANGVKNFVRKKRVHTSWALSYGSTARLMGEPSVTGTPSSRTESVWKPAVVDDHSIS